MNKVQFILLHNFEFLIYTVCLIGHVIGAVFFLRYGYNVIFFYNLISSCLYATFLLVYRNVHQNRLLFTLFYLEWITYDLILTFQTGTDFGITIITVSLIPAMFLFLISTRTPPSYYITMITIDALSIIFVLWSSYSRNGLLTAGYITSVTTHRGLYIAHIVMITTGVSLMLVYLSLITEEKILRYRRRTQRRSMELDYLANHDQLTGLLNRRKINFCIKKYEEERLAHDRDYALTIFDIDNFKRVNDTYGHDAGDFILVEVVKTVKRCLQDDEMIARWGGEEFIILFSNRKGKIILELNAIRETVSLTDFIWKGTKIPITLTFGLSSTHSCPNMDRLIADADSRLMYGKQNGKNQVVYPEDF